MKRLKSRRTGSAYVFASGTLLAASIFTGHASADPFEISTPTFETNGGFPIDDDDILLITDRGSITVTGDDVVGVRAGSNNELTNFGLINTSGERASGILGVGDNNVMTNHGGITVRGNSLAGLDARGDHNLLENHGDITSRDVAMGAIGNFNTSINRQSITAKYGMAANGSDNNITNTGNILGRENASAPGLRGFWVTGDRNTLENSNSITNFVDGMRADGNQNDLTNSRFISAIASGMIARGNQNTLTNSGDIVAGEIGIEAIGSGNTLTNSGTVRTLGFGLTVEGDSNGISNTGEIEAGRALNATGRFNVLENGGRITGGAGIVSSGSDNQLKNATDGVINATARGLFIADGARNTVVNEGEINAGLAGMEASNAQDSTLENRRRIVASQIGISVTNLGTGVSRDNTVINSGEIAALIGVDMGGEHNTAINTGDILNGTIVGSVGISATGNHHIVENFGTIDVDRQALKVRGDFNTAVNRNVTNSATSLFAEGNQNTLVNAATAVATSEGIVAIGNENDMFNYGELTVLGFGSGIRASGNLNILGNFGNVTAVRGLEAIGDRNELQNSGRITTSESHALATDGDFNRLTNFGELNGLSGFRTFGDNNTSINHGIVTGQNGMSAFFGTENLVQNFGRVDATEIGLWIGGERNTIDNAGIVTGQKGLIADGTGHLLANSGRVVATEVGVQVGGDGNTIDNSGFVSAADAFLIFGTNTIMNLRAPSFIVGRMRLGTGGTTVNISPGASHSVVWDFDETFAGGSPNVTGRVPYVFNAETGQFATLENSGFAAAYDSLGDMTSLLSNVGREGLSGRISSAYGSAYGTKDGGAADAASAYDQGLWVTPFGGRSRHQGDEAALDRDITQAGLALGYRWQHQDDLGLSAMGGYVQDKSKASSPFAKAHEGEADGAFAGLSGRKQWGNLFLDFALTGGVLSHEQSRFINDNLATDGRAFAEASFDSRFLSPEAGLSMSFDWGYGFSVVPGAKIRYAAQWLDGYTETGSNGAATVDDRMIGLVEASAELAAVQRFDFGSVTARLGIISRSSVGDDAAGITLVGVDANAGFGISDDVAGYAGLGASFDASETLKLQFDGQAIFGDDVTGIQGQARIIQRF